MYFPIPQDFIFAKGHTVTIRGGTTDARGFVHRAYRRSDREVVYHVYRVTRGIPDLSGPDQHGPWMLTVTQEELHPPVINWKLLPAEFQWWRNGPLYLTNPSAAEVFSFWPAPKTGWQKGDFVSVPSFGCDDRVCARVVEAEDETGCLVVAFKPLDGRSIKSRFPLGAILGPHTEWHLDPSEWEETQPLQVVRKRARSSSPPALSLGENALPEAIAEKKARILTAYEEHAQTLETKPADPEWLDDLEEPKDQMDVAKFFSEHDWSPSKAGPDGEK